MRIPVYLNKDKDRELYDFFKSLPNFSNWVRDCARREIEQKRVKEQQSDLLNTQSISELVEKLIDMRLAGKVLTNNNPEVIRESEGFNIEDDILSELEDYM